MCVENYNLLFFYFIDFADVYVLTRCRIAFGDVLP